MNHLYNKVSLWIIIFTGFFQQSLMASQAVLSNNVSITYTTSGNWATSYQLSITMANQGSTQIKGWTLEFDLKNSGQSVKNPPSGITNTGSANHAKFSSPSGIINAGASINIKTTILKVSNTDPEQNIINILCTPTGATNQAPAPVVTPVITTPVITTPIITPKPTSPSSSTSTPKIIGYFPNWLVYERANTSAYPKQAQARPKFTPDNIDINTSKLTHVYFAFAKPYTLNADPDALANMDPSKDSFCNVAFNTAYWNSGIKSYKVSIVDPWCDTCIPMGNGKGHFAALRALKKSNPSIKTILSIGGWTIYNQGMPAEKFSTMVASPATRKEFIDSTILFAKKYGFDGADIDFEYPGFNGGKPADTQNYTILLKEFRDAINKLGYPFILTLAAPAGLEKMQKIEISKIHQYVDWINLMTYDFNGSDWSQYASHNAPLYAPVKGDDPNFNADYAVQYYLQQGVPAEKLILGMALYGRSFAKVPSTPVVPGLPGLFNKYTGTGSQVTDDGAGYQSWPNIKNNLLLPTSGYTRYWDEQAKVPYLYNPTTQDLISYDDDQSLGIKAQYVNDKKLGGAMFWQLENDKSIWSSIGNVQSILNGGKPSISTTQAPAPITTPVITTPAVTPIVTTPVIQPVVTPVITTPIVTPTQPVATSGNFKTDYSTTSDWKSGYQSSIVITNNGSEINGWTLEFDLASSEQTINNLWGGVKDVASTGSHIKVTNPTWSGGGKIATGASLTIGMTVNKDSNSTAGVKNIVFTPAGSQPVNTPSTSTVVPTTTTIVTPTVQPTTSTPTPIKTSTTNSVLTVKYSKTEDDWKTGYQGAITITNTSSSDIFGWTLEFDFVSSDQKVGNIWTCIKDEKATQGSHVKVTNPSLAKIGANSSITLGMIVSKNASSTPGIINATCIVTPDTVIAPGEATPFVTPSNPTPITPGKHKVIGYFPNWLVYPRANNTAFPKQNENRPLFTPADIDVVGSKLTHICYAFAKPYTLNADPKALDKDKYGKVDPGTDNFCNITFNNAYWNSGIRSYEVSIVDPWCDTCIPMKYEGNTYFGHFAVLRALKAKHPGLKTIISIGGWTIYNQGTPAAKFSTMVASAATRKEFIDSSIAFTQKYGFDGIDIDFEYPAYEPNGGRKEDTQNYTIFLKEFRDALTIWNSANPTKQLELTIAAPAGITNMRNMEVSKIHQYVDWINLMSYDFNGDWASTTGHNAPLTAPLYNGKAFGDGVDRAANYTPTFYADYAIQYYLKQGVPAEKMVLGMALYGRSFANAAATEKVPGYPGLYNEFDHKISGSQVTDDGRSYQSWPNIKNNILPNLATNGYKRYWDKEAKVPYLFNPNYSNPNIPTAKTDLITYDDDESLGIKAQYVKDTKLGGAMFWQLENDKSIWSAIGNVATVMNK